jgi:hypothetical protein
MDIDFIVQGLALEHIHAFDGRAMNDTAAVIAMLAETGALAAADAGILCDALDLYQAATHLLRIAAVRDPREMPCELEPILARAAGTADIPGLEARLRETQRDVRHFRSDDPRQPGRAVPEAAGRATFTPTRRR